MYKIAYLIISLLLLSSYSAKSKQNKNSFTILFESSSFIDVNFTKRTMKYELFKNSNKIHFSTEEEKIIEQSFTKNQIAAIRGNIDYINKGGISPLLIYKVKLFKNEKLLATILVDHSYNIKTTKQLSKQYKPASFANDLQKVLNNNEDYKKLLNLARKYEDENHLLRL